MTRIVFSLVTVFILGSFAAAKRMNPKPVTAVESDGIQYSADGDGRDQYVVAKDMRDGKELWRVKVFHSRIKFWIEEDVQWVFISDLKLKNRSLLVRDERGRCYSISLKSHKSRKIRCGAEFADRKL